MRISRIILLIICLSLLLSLVGCFPGGRSTPLTDIEKIRTAFEEIDRRITRDLTRREVAELAQLLKKIAGLTMPGAEGKP